jgi:cytochrome oxidase Cu insertion factor (SCO1/SenC/PrrC family)
MAVSSHTKKSVSEKKAVTRVPGDWLDRRDKLIVASGVGISMFLALCLGLVMYGLKSGTSTLDPDAGTLVIKPDYPRHLVDFSLTDHLGQTVTRKDLTGKIVVVDFLFTSCSLTCPVVNAQMERIQKATTGQPDVRLLSLTLDPVDDTVPVLARYAPGFHADPTRWSFLTGDESTMHYFVGTSFLPPDTTGQFSYMPGNFAHIQRIVLVDKGGQVVSYFDGLDPNAADAVLEQIKKLKANP